MEDHQPAVQVAVLCMWGGARVKCVGGLVELVRKNSKNIVKVVSIIIGLPQRTQRRKN